MTPQDLTVPRFRDAVANTFVADATLDAALFVSKLTNNATFELGGQPEVAGRDSIRAMLDETFKAFSSIQHELRQVVEADARDLLIYEAAVHYAFADGRKASIEYANILEFEGDLVRRYRIYLDLSALN